MILQGKRILITGAASGLGAATLSSLTSSGAKVIGIDKRRPAGAASEDILIADLRDAVQIREAVATAIARLGGLDILINNAGILDLQDPGVVPEADVAEHFDVNFLAAWRTTAVALPSLLESRGRVINVSSLFAVANAPFIPAYAASKRAIAAYSDILRMQHGGRIGVTTVYPGYMDTPIHDKAVQQGLSVGRIVSFKMGNRTLLTLEEPIEVAAHSMVRICAGRNRRDCTLTFFGWLSFVGSRHFPGFSDAFIRWRIGQLARAHILNVTLAPKT